MRENEAASHSSLFRKSMRLVFLICLREKLDDLLLSLSLSLLLQRTR